MALITSKKGYFSWKLSDDEKVRGKGKVKYLGKSK